MEEKHYIWYEKYRPSTMETYICTDELKSSIDEWIENQDIPHLLFQGKQGSGKSTLAKILATSIDCDYLYINAGDKRKMDDIRDDILPFISSMSFKPSAKIVILDECTSMLPAAQVLLLNMIETYSSHARFILTGNYVERLIPPLRSRLEEWNLVPPSMKVVAKHVKSILDKEQVEYELNDIATVVKKFYPDTRKIIGELQKHTKDNKLTLPTLLENNSDIENKIIKELKNKKYNSFQTIRQFIADGGISDFEGIYNRLYKDSSLFAPDKEGLVTVIVNESMFQSVSVIDKEICFMSCIQKIIEIL